MITPLWTARRVRLAGLVVGMAIAGLVGWLVLPLSSAGEQPASKVPVDWARPVVDDAGLAARSGVKLVHVAVTGGGGLVDLRYQVVDPDAAAALHDATTPPAIVDEESGLVVHDLFMGHAHHGTFKAGVSYYYVLVDSVNWIHRGSTVTVLLGDAQLEHVVVR